jgi:BMFP domain-containing protein YqiC
MNAKQLRQKCDDLEKRVSKLEAQLHEEARWHEKINRAAQKLRNAQGSPEARLGDGHCSH